MAHRTVTTPATTAAHAAMPPVVVAAKRPAAHVAKRPVVDAATLPAVPLDTTATPDPTVPARTTVAVDSMMTVARRAAMTVAPHVRTTVVVATTTTVADRALTTAADPAAMTAVPPTSTPVAHRVAALTVVVTISAAHAPTLLVAAHGRTHLVDPSSTDLRASARQLPHRRRPTSVASRRPRSRSVSSLRNPLVSNAKPARHQHAEITKHDGPPKGDGVRLQKVLAQAGVASRRAAEELIDQGRVEVDGRIVVEQGLRVDPENAVVRVDGVRVVVQKDLVYLAMNKPRGCSAPCPTISVVRASVTSSPSAFSRVSGSSTSAVSTPTPKACFSSPTTATWLTA